MPEPLKQGITSAGFDVIINDAELKDMGTSRYPWSAAFKARLKTVLIRNAHNNDQIKAWINKLVLDELGPGLLGRGPL